MYKLWDGGGGRAATKCVKDSLNTKCCVIAKFIEVSIRLISNNFLKYLGVGGVRRRT